MKKFKLSYLITRLFVVITKFFAFARDPLQTHIKHHFWTLVSIQNSTILLEASFKHISNTHFWKVVSILSSMMLLETSFNIILKTTFVKCFP